jgi:cation:H+ antiporter
VKLLIDLLQIGAGGLILYLGAEWLVKGSAGLARAFGVRPLVIGLTVVAYGTSAPELAVSAAAILDDSSAIALGNIVGSCVANIGLILGITALIAPPSVDARLIRREIPILAASAAAVPLVLIDGRIEYWEAGLLLACAIGFTFMTLGVSARRHPDEIEIPEEALAEDDEEAPRKLILATLTVVGLGALLGGGELFVEGAKGLAEALGMSERLIGLTVVAVGTSLPELAASVVAALRGFSGLAVGNIVGSNIFNVFLVLGAVGLIKPIDGSLSALRLDMIFLIGLTLLGVLVMRGSRVISRPEGVLLLAAYASFVVLAILGW